MKIYLFSQPMSRYCMIYFGYPPIKGFQFLEQILYKKSDIKILFIVIISWTIIWHFRKKNKNGVTRLIIFQEGQSYPHPYKFRGYLKKIKECNFCHLYYSIFLVRGNFALQEEKRKKKQFVISAHPGFNQGPLVPKSDTLSTRPGCQVVHISK